MKLGRKDTGGGRKRTALAGRIKWVAGCVSGCEGQGGACGQDSNDYSALWRVSHTLGDLRVASCNCFCQTRGGQVLSPFLRKTHASWQKPGLHSKAHVLAAAT